MGYGFWSLILVAFIAASLTLQGALNNGFINFNTTWSNEVGQYSPLVPSHLYNCHYAGLWCTCYTNNRGGCTVGCNPNIYKTVVNQTSCPQVSDFILAGFDLL